MLQHAARQRSRYVTDCSKTVIDHGMLQYAAGRRSRYVTDCSKTETDHGLSQTAAGQEQATVSYILQQDRDRSRYVTYCSKTWLDNSVIKIETRHSQAMAYVIEYSSTQFADYTDCIETERVSRSVFYVQLTSSVISRRRLIESVTLCSMLS